LLFENRFFQVCWWILLYRTTFHLQGKTYYLITRVLDPDPHGFALIGVAGSGFGSRKAKMTHKNVKSKKKFHVLKSWIFSVRL
jgi:hypothetical protein